MTEPWGPRCLQIKKMEGCAKEGGDELALMGAQNISFLTCVPRQEVQKGRVRS